MYVKLFEGVVVPEMTRTNQNPATGTRAGQGGKSRQFIGVARGLLVVACRWCDHYFVNRFGNTATAGPEACLMS